MTEIVKMIMETIVKTLHDFRHDFFFFHDSGHGNHDWNYEEIMTKPW